MDVISLTLYLCAFLGVQYVSVSDISLYRQLYLEVQGFRCGRRTVHPNLIKESWGNIKRKAMESFSKIKES